MKKFYLKTLEYVGRDELSRFTPSLDYRLIHDSDLICDKWLLSSEPKRYLFEKIYCQFLETDRSFKILDIAGGLHSWSLDLASRNDLTLIEKFIHKSESDEKIQQALLDQGCIISDTDWSTVAFQENFDVAICNDFFPNVDQRFGEFLEKCSNAKIPRILLTLTTYVPRRAFSVQRTDAEEQLTVLSLPFRELEDILFQYCEGIIPGCLDEEMKTGSSPYPNGRHVFFLEVILSPETRLRVP